MHSIFSSVFCVWKCGQTQSFSVWYITYNPPNISAHAPLVSTRHVSEYSPAKTGEHLRIFPNFENRVRCEKYLKDDKHNSLHLVQNKLGYLYLDIICSLKLTFLSYALSILFTSQNRLCLRTIILAYFIAHFRLHAFVNFKYLLISDNMLIPLNPVENYLPLFFSLTYTFPFLRNEMTELIVYWSNILFINLLKWYGRIPANSLEKSSGWWLCQA